MSKSRKNVPTRKTQLAHNPLLNKLLNQQNSPPNTPPADDRTWVPEYQAIAEMLRNGDTERALQRCETLAAHYPHERENIPNLCAALLSENRRFQDAIAMWQRIPNWQNKASLQSNIGRTHQLANQLDLAHNHLSIALQLEPNHLDALVNMGVVLQKLERRQEAIENYQKILSINPHYELARFNLATVYQDELDFQAAYQCYDHLLRENPQYVNALANLIFTQHYVVPYQPEVIFERAKRLGQLYVEKSQSLAIKLPAQNAEKPLHIGLVSADLQTHPVGFFVESLLKSQAAQQLTWSAYANSPTFDALSARLKPVFQNWHHVNTWGDERLIQQIQADGVDILVDLSGLTRGNRIGVFAAQAAPVQINWLGYFGTTGLSTMQAVIADPYCVPPDEENRFVERVWRMPHSRLCLSVPTENVPTNELPALTNGYITFACFQNLPKINDEVLAIWAQIARRLPESRWHFQNLRLGENSQDQEKLAIKLREFGFNMAQVSFRGSVPRAEYFAHHQDIDLILDTFPYCGGTTTSEALWMGVPTLTFAQSGMLARQGEQLLSAAGLPEWVCYHLDDYVERAVYWGQPENWQQLNEIRVNLREKVLQSPLFDAEQFGRDWCDLVRKIWRDACGE